MIKINLVAETPAAATVQAERPQFSLGAKQGDVILLIVLALGLVVVGTQWLLLTSKRSDLQEVESQRRRERDELLVYIKKVEELEARRELLRHKINVINELKRNQQGPVRILDEVSRALPELVWLGSLKLVGNNVELGGSAMDENAVANYISNLDASPFFDEPVLKNLSRARGDTFGFSLSFAFNNAPPEIEAAEGSQAAGSGQ
ncbi:MAG: PilN domain-containing protein [Acidobacteria bacterium]|uniref:PilN domain-containing protein n=1 Tax=Candidatus Sulfomarinibacter kjeldsenii TaxID=2885994 RepID=A0A8J6XYQ9_9BACT|nr:PilN domain-containing protein [Candidatus Sulfomarinibacter kjeldsenii]